MNDTNTTQTAAPKIDGQAQNPQVPPAQQMGQPAQMVPQKPIDRLKAKFSSLPKNTRIIVVAIAALFLIILLLSVLVSLFGKGRGTILATPSPSPISESPIPNVILNASRYATDSGVLKIESDLQDLGKQLDASDVKQSSLKLPNLDFNINFNQ